MANHLIIGLGGTGGKILRAMRKRVYEQFGSNTETGDFHFDYIYVDSNEDDLNEQKSWKYQGHSIHLAESQKVSIHGIGGGVLNNLDDYPALRAFINQGDQRLMQGDQIAGIINEGIGGQRRRFGRTLFAYNTLARPQHNYRVVLQKRINDMVHGHGNGAGNAGITFHICAGLAGGTGSGSIVDAVALLQEINREMGMNYEVFLYLYIPENNAGHADHHGFYYANGYAALQELNALSLRQYKPTDITGTIDHTTGQVRRLVKDGPEPFKMAYLFSEMNEENKVLDKDKKLPSAVADFMYQRIIFQGRMNALEGLENEGAHPELDADGEPVHARNFISFGIKRIIYPESEIRGYVNYKNEASTIIAILHNLWNQGSGYLPQSDEDAGFGFGLEARQPGTWERFWLDYLSVTLQQALPNYPASDDWSSFSTFWNEVCNVEAEETIEENDDRHLWLPDYLTRCDLQHDQLFRGLGVRTYFNTQRRPENVSRHAAVIIKRIESELFSEWVSGMHGDQAMSLQKVRLFLNELKNATEERIPAIAYQKAGLKSEKEEATDKLAILEDKIKDVGWLLHLLFRFAKKYFMQYAAQKAEVYTLECQIEACDYAELLLKEVVTRLNTMLVSVTRLQNLIAQASIDATTAAETTCVPTQHLQGEVIVEDKRFDPTEVRDEVQRLLLINKELQDTLKKNVMQQLNQEVANAGKPALFQEAYVILGGACQQGLNADVREENTEKLLAFISSCSEPAITDELNKIAEAEPSERLLGVNILDRIKQDYQTPDALEQYLKTISQECRVQLKLDGQQMGVNAQAIARYKIQISLPFSTDNAFKTIFRQKCQNVFNGDLFDPNNSITELGEDEPKNEIVFLTAYAGFPIRYAYNLNHMKERYDSLTSPHDPQQALNKVLLHTETFSEGNTLPNLYQESAEDVLIKRKNRVIKTTLKLYQISEKIEERVNPQSKESLFRVNTNPGDIANPEYHIIGKGFRETVAKLMEDPKFRNLQTWVDRTLNSTYNQDSRRTQLPQQLTDYVFKTVLPNDYADYDMDPEFINVRVIMNILIAELKNS